MKFFLEVCLIFLQVISLIVSCCYGVSAVQKRNWIKTDATITFIGKPQGVVFGDFTDDKGILHEEEALYSDLRFFGYGGRNVEPYYGKQVKILYKPSTGEIVSYDNLLMDALMSVGLFGITSVVLFIINKKRKQD